jgi:hypothetical protein
MSAVIYKFERPAAQPKPAHKPTAIEGEADVGQMLGRSGKPLPEPLTETCKNQRLRLTRREVWRRAEFTTRYWRARLDWDSALSWAQSNDIGDAKSFPPARGSSPLEDRFSLVDTWRDALMKQMLTPAPDAGAVAWKRAQLRAENYRYTDVKPERIERAIAEDVAFLAAHPTKSNRETLARDRDFQEAMRQRIRDIAASRDLPDEEIRPALSLKHQEIATFAEKHGVDFGWLLEGKGQTFKSGPTS